MMEIEYFPFERQMIGLQTGAQRFSLRRGFLFRTRDSANAAWKYSEASPLPGFSAETYAEIEQFLLDDSNRKSLVRAFAGEELFLPASLRFAAEALHALDHSAKGGLLQCSGLVGISDPLQSLSEVNALFAKKFVTIKFKISPASLSHTALFLEEMIATHPLVKIRLDANCSLKKGAFAAFCESMSEALRQHIEYIEDPYPCFESDAPDMWGIPLAIDSSFSKFSQLRLYELPSEFVFVIKPSVHLSPLRIARETQQATTAGKKIVFSSGLESELGLLALQNLCIQYAGRNWAHGVATANVFSNALIADVPTLSGTQNITEPLRAWLTSLSWRQL